MERDGELTPRMMLVREAMSRGVVSVPAEASMNEVAKEMTKFDVSGVAVTDEVDGTIGVATQTDLMEHYGEDGSELTVTDIMTELPETIRPEADLIEASEKMSKEGIHRLFVVPGGEIFECSSCMGVLTSTDLVEAMVEEG